MKEAETSNFQYFSAVFLVIKLFIITNCDSQPVSQSISSKDRSRDQELRTTCCRDHCSQSLSNVAEKKRYFSIFSGVILSVKKRTAISKWPIGLSKMSVMMKGHETKHMSGTYGDNHRLFISSAEVVW